MYQTYESASQQRLIVVANRLPVSAVRERDGSWSLQVHFCMWLSQYAACPPCARSDAMSAGPVLSATPTSVEQL